MSKITLAFSSCNPLPPLLPKKSQSPMARHSFKNSTHYNPPAAPGRDAKIFFIKSCNLKFFRTVWRFRNQIIIRRLVLTDPATNKVLTVGAGPTYKVITALTS